MAATAGKIALVKIASSQAGPFTTIANIKTANVEVDGVNIDVTALGAANSFMARIQGLLDAKIALAGNYDTADTTGQVALRTAFLAGSAIWLNVLPNGVNGFQTQCVVTKFAIAADVSKESNLTVDLEGTGGITMI